MKPHAALDPTTIDSDRKLLNNSFKIGDRDLLSKYNNNIIWCNFGSDKVAWQKLLTMITRNRTVTHLHIMCAHTR